MVQTRAGCRQNDFECWPARLRTIPFFLRSESHSLEREARLQIGNESSDEMSAPKKFKPDLPEPEFSDEEAWEKKRKTALGQIQNGLKFCFQS